MTARHYPKRDRTTFRRIGRMVAQTPKAAGSNTSSTPTNHASDSVYQSVVDPEDSSVDMDLVDSTSYMKISQERAWQETVCRHSERASPEIYGSTTHETSLSTSSCCPSSTTGIQDQIVELLTHIIPGSEGEVLVDAFLTAPELPPITKQSLGELDIQNIIGNIKLRHDVNFDRDLSFRPNLDGSKGQEKMKAAGKYWKALVAELELYRGLFGGNPSLCDVNGQERPEIIRHTQRRIPKMFETIQEVLKSLVPDRDHSRVDEHLNVPTLMLEIERNICDLVRLSQWLAHLLKEHCAPMRDKWVDRIVEWTETGVSNNNPELIVYGLRELLGILEAMKLDVANHQIRNLKTLLIADTVNFERHYHLDRLVHGRSRVDVEAAHEWYVDAKSRFRQPRQPPQRDAMRVQLEVFVRAVVSTLYSTDRNSDFPETFYLDQERLRVLKSEMADSVYFKICYDWFLRILKRLGHHAPIPPSTRGVLHARLSAIIGEATVRDSSPWLVNSENISAELVRHALTLSGRPQEYDMDMYHEANKDLAKCLKNFFSDTASALESCVLPQVLSCIDRNIHSSPLDLFNNLVTSQDSAPHLQSLLQPSPHFDSISNISASHQHEFGDMPSRVSHIILLHWRIWGPMAYVLEEGSMPPSESRAGTTTEAPMPPRLKTGETPDANSEALEIDRRSYP